MNIFPLFTQVRSITCLCSGNNHALERSNQQKITLIVRYQNRQINRVCFTQFARKYHVIILRTCFYVFSAITQYWTCILHLRFAPQQLSICQRGAAGTYASINKWVSNYGIKKPLSQVNRWKNNIRPHGVGFSPLDHARKTSRILECLFVVINSCFCLCWRSWGLKLR